MESKLTEEESLSKLSRLIKAINTLTTPLTATNASPETGNETDSDNSFQLIDKVLEENLLAINNDIQKSPQLHGDFGELADLLRPDNLHQSLMNREEISIREKHVEVCICLLHKVCVTLEVLSNFITYNDEERGSSAPKLNPDSLSAPQIKSVSLALQFVVVLGMCPYLSPGVGIPVSQRMGPGHILLATVRDYGTELSHLGRVKKLLLPAKLMCDMLSVQSLRDIVINNHLHDLLSLLFQLRFSIKNIQDQEMKYNADKHEHVTKAAAAEVSHQRINMINDGNNGKGKEDSYVYEAKSLPAIYLYCAKKPWTLPLVREHCNQFIDKTVHLSSTPHVLKTLMILSGGGKSSRVSMPIKTPVWYKRTVAGLLRDVLMVPHGIQHLIALLVAGSSGGHEWQKCKAVAQVIAQLPTSANNIEQFHKSVSSQLIAIIQSSPGAPSISIVRAVGATILELTNRQPSLMETVCLSLLFEPLLRISSQNEISHIDEGNIIVPEPVLNSCVECLHRLYVLGQEPQSPLLLGLRKMVGILFGILLAARSGISLLKSKSEDLIGAYLGYCEPEESVRCILKLICSNKDKDDAIMFPYLHCDICITFGQSEGVQALKQRGINLQEESVDSWTKPVEAVMDILNGLKSDIIIPQLFICLLQKLTSIVKSECATAASMTGDIFLPPRLMNFAQRNLRLTELREKVCLVNLLAAVGDKYGDGVVSNGGHVLEFVKATLERCVQICQACNDEETMQFEWETVSMAMGLLTAVLSGGVEVGDQSQLLDELLPLLTFISDSEVDDPKVKEMADDLKVAVATKGLVWAELSLIRKEQGKNKDSNSSRKEKKNKNLIEVLSETNMDDDLEKNLEPNATSKESGKASGAKSISPLEQALEELCDPLLPVRGHGLIALARLVEDRNPEVENKQEVLLKVFLENLAHTDSYVYLASVNGLAALSDLCPDQIIPRLTSELRVNCAHAGGGENVKSTENLVLKVAEAVVKATRRLGEMTPKYRDLLLPAILCSCRHTDSLTRASCLSGLAEVCQLLRFALGPVLYEVITCCRDVLSSDPDPEPRKAAAMTFALILRGLGKDTLLALDGALIDLYRILKHAVTNDLEEGVRTHAAIALEELDNIMRDALFAKPELSKRISILGLQ